MGDLTLSHILHTTICHFFTADLPSNAKNPPKSAFASADFSSLIFSTQKNGVKDESISNKSTVNT